MDMAEWFLITREQLERRLRGFAYARAALVTAVLGVCVFLERDRVFILEVKPWYLHLVFVAAYLLCLVQLIGVRRQVYRSNTLIWLHIFFDICVVTGIVHFTGSLESPFAFFYVVVILAASVLLTQTATLLSALFSTLAFAGLSIATHQGWLESPSALGAFSRDVTTIPLAEFWSQLGMLVLSFHVSAFLGGYLSRSLKIQREIQDDLLQSLRTGLVAFDDAGRISFMNRAAERIFARESLEVLGDPVEALFPEGQGAFLRKCYDQGEEVLDEEVSAEIGGAPRILEISASSSSTGHQRHLALINDVTRLRSLEERIRIQEKLSTVGEAAAGVAHEIRNPLASIRAAAKALEEADGFLGEDARLIRLILRESDRLARTVSIFLDFAKMSMPVRQIVSLNRWLQGFAEEWEKRAKQRGQERVPLDLNLPREELKASLDKNQFRIVLENLLDNAVQAGATAVKLELQTVRNPRLPKAQMAKVSVADNGQGISERARSRLFEPFFTTKAAGTGMGLAIVERIVAAHEGRVAAENGLEGGAVFSLLLDLIEEER